jgi:hypothetical protein
MQGTKRKNDPMHGLTILLFGGGLMFLGVAAGVAIERWRACSWYKNQLILCRRNLPLA